MKRFPLILVVGFLFIFGSVLSQNLVLNPSFEEVYRCPNLPNVKGDVRAIAPHWWSPSIGTPDLYNTCNRHNLGVNNFAGFTTPKDGKGFVGMVLYETHGYREFLQGELVCPLEKGKFYKVSMYFKQGRNAGYLGGGLGFYFTADSLGTMDSLKLGWENGDWVGSNPYEVNDRVWKKMELVYEAKGDEQYITIGNVLFTFLPEIYHKDPPINCRELEHASYAYVDLIEVMEMYLENDYPGPIIVPDLHFASGSHEVIGGFPDTLKTLAAFLENNPSVKIVIEGHTDDVGSETANQELSRYRAFAVRNYFTLQGIDDRRIKTYGYGESRPLIDETTQEARERNRRVEIKVLSTK